MPWALAASASSSRLGLAAAVGAGGAIMLLAWLYRSSRPALRRHRGAGGGSVARREGGGGGGGSPAVPLPAELSFLDAGDAIGSQQAQQAWRDEEEELLAEQWSRNVAFLGAEGQARLRAATVAVVGVGGVGSHAAQLLARTGVGRLSLVDPGRVTAATLASSAVAAASDVGALKAEVWACMACAWACARASSRG